MRSIFTIHASEFAVGEFIEKNFPKLDVWIPAKDTDVDLLVTGEPGLPPIALQVKLLRDYTPPEGIDEFEKSIVAAGWLKLDHEKLANSKADLWIIVLVSHERKMTPQFVVIPPHELLRRLMAIHGKSKTYQVYPWITKSGVCLEGRGLQRAHKKQLVEGTLVLGERDLSAYLDNWSAFKRLSTKT